MNIESRSGGTVKTSGNPFGNFMFRVTPDGGMAPSNLGQVTSDQGFEYISSTEMSPNNDVPTRGFWTQISSTERSPGYAN